MRSYQQLDILYRLIDMVVHIPGKDGLDVVSFFYVPITEKRNPHMALNTYITLNPRIVCFTIRPLHTIYRTPKDVFMSLGVLSHEHRNIGVTAQRFDVGVAQLCAILQTQCVFIWERAPLCGTHTYYPVVWGCLWSKTHQAFVPIAIATNYGSKMHCVYEKAYGWEEYKKLYQER